MIEMTQEDENFQKSLFIYVYLYLYACVKCTCGNFCELLAQPSNNTDKLSDINALYHI